MDKIKDDESAGLFSTGLPNHKALISFYNFIEPKLTNMQCWKDVTLLRESQLYQVKHNRKKLGLQESFHAWMNCYLYLYDFRLVYLYKISFIDLGSPEAWCKDMHNMDQSSIYGTTRPFPISSTRTDSQEYAARVCSICNN